MNQEHSQLTGINTRRRLLKGLAAGAAGLGALSVASSAMAFTPADTAVESVGGADGYGGDFGGGLAAIRLRPATAAMPTATGHQSGEFFVGSDGSLYYSTVAVAGGPATNLAWRKLAAPAATATHYNPGVLFLLPGPDRWADTRAAQAANFPNVTPQGNTVGVKSIQISGVNGWRSGVAIPAGVKAVFGSIFAVNPSGASGVAKVYKEGEDTTKIAGTLAWLGVSAFGPFFSGVNEAGKITLEVTGQAPSNTANPNGAGIAIDIAGYYL